MNFKVIFKQLNILSQCHRYGLSLWQCPQFLFLIMGLIIIISTFLSYAISGKYIEDPGIVAVISLLITAILFIIAFVIVRGFERLAEASRMKSEFISVVSHQLRSPLTNLRWTIDFLTALDVKEMTEKKNDYYRILKENALRMGELIDNLLVVSRLEEGKFPLNKEEISLEELIRRLIKNSQSTALALNAEVEFTAEEGLPKVFCDESQIKLLIDNLLNNAVRYIKGKGKVIIKLSRKKNNLIFEITDNGVGIPKDDQKYIFQKFFRSQNALRQQTQGTGLGLYIAKSIAENSGGKIGFKSQEGVGSTFWFTLPIK